MSGKGFFRRRSHDESLAVVKDTIFKPKKLFESDGERITFRSAREVCGELHQPDFYVMAQVSLGALVKSDPERQAGWYEINELRCDLAIFTIEGKLCLVIEINGKGHHGKNDDIKGQVFKSAGIEILTLTGEELPTIMRKIILGRLPGSEASKDGQIHLVR